MRIDVYKRQRVLNADKLGRNAAAFVRKHFGNRRAEAAVDVAVSYTHLDVYKRQRLYFTP